ncbi:MAG TPA: hypothetical protein GXX57_02540 [Firmicutes bacterium]|nr:hypothetical protein [Bacillota bacterium]
MNRRLSLIITAITVLVLSVAPAFAEKNPQRAKAYFLATPPTIDGDLSDWDLSTPSIIIGAGSNVMRGDWEGEHDLTAKIYIGWDYGYLYFAVDAIDDCVLGTFDLSDYWARDRINFAFDALNNTTADAFTTDSPGRTRWQDDDYWIYVIPFDGDEEQGSLSMQHNSFWKTPPGFRVASSRTDNGYVCEIIVPISELPEMWVDEGVVIGFDVFITDGDVDDWGILTMSEIMWGRFDYPGTAIKWQYWKVGALEFVME